MNLIALRNEAAGLGEEWEPEPPAADRLPDLQAPTLLIVGDEDQPRVFAAADLLEKDSSPKRAQGHNARYGPRAQYGTA